jgi:hypothetical protein
MAYRQKVTNHDVRNIPLKDLPKQIHESAQVEEEAQAAHVLVAHHPGADLRRITLAAVPLVLILIAASYLDVTRHWVVPFAQWLMHLAS